MSPQSPLRTVLIVDDCLEDRELYRRYLLKDETHVYQLVEASSGVTGLECWQQRHPDVVILDYQLPDFSGLEFLSQLQSLSQQMCLPVVMVTGQGSEAIAVQALRAGVQDYLIKGQITPENLCLAIDRAIEAVQLRNQLQQRIERERLIAQITQQIYQSLDPSDVLQTAVTQIRQFLYTDRVIAIQLESVHRGTVVAESVGSEWRSLASTNIYDPCLTDVCGKYYQQGHITATSDIENSNLEHCYIELLTELQVRANLVVPILIHEAITPAETLPRIAPPQSSTVPPAVPPVDADAIDRAATPSLHRHPTTPRLWGLLIAHHCVAPRQWQSLEIDLLQELATHLSIAIRQAELHQQTQAELIQQKNALRASEEQLRLALNFSQVGLWDWNIQTNQVLWNDNNFRLLGLTPTRVEASYESWRDRIHPDDVERVEAVIQHVLAAQSKFELQYRVVHPNEEIRWLYAKGQLTSSAMGQPLRMLGASIDITDRKLTELKISQLNQRLQLLIQVIQQLAGARDLTTIMAVVKTTVRQIAAADGTTFILRQGDESYYAEEEAIAPLWKGQRFLLKDCISGWAILNREVVLIPDVYADSRIPLEDYRSTFVKSLAMVPMISSEPIGAIGVYWATDYTPTQDEVSLLQSLADAAAIAIQNVRFYESAEQQVQQRTAQLQQSLNLEALLKRITDRVRDSLDENQILQTVVDELAAGLGLECCDTGIYNAERTTSVITHEFTKTLKPAKGETLIIAEMGLLDVYQALFQGQLCQFCEVTSSLPRLDEEFCTILACPIRDNQDTLGDLWLFKANPTVFSELEVRLVQQVANQCAIALRQSRLYQAVQSQVTRLEQLNHLKDDFLSTVSHELRAPMANIKMATQMLEIIFNIADDSTREGNLPAIALTPSQTAKAIQYFQILNRECHRETDLINDLLDLARLDADTPPFMLTEIRVQDWLPHLAEAFIERTQQQQQQLQIDIPADLPPLTTDLPSLERILTELLQNACKYTPPAETIRVTATERTSLIQIAVCNSGVEIPSVERDRIFDKFYRIPTNDPWKHEGTGLGLALVKKLVDLLQGFIIVNSEQNQTTFTVALPWQLDLSVMETIEITGD